MFRVALWSLRQRRYRALAGFMALIAVICAVLGTYEIHRFQQKRHDNGALRANAHAAPTPLTTALVPLVGQGSAPGAVAIRYRTVTATGTYEADDEQYVDDQSQGGRQGFFVLTPLRTDRGTVLVVRGFVVATSSGTRPASVPAAPRGTVHITGRLQTAQTSDDQPGRLGHAEITSVNPVHQSRRLGQPVFAAYVTLAAHAPGTAGLAVAPAPGLSNPTGGASEPQLLSYVVQWYAFMLLALAAPFLFARSEVRDAQRRFLGIDPDAREFGLPAGPTDAPALPAGSPAAVALRDATAVAERGAQPSQRWQQAARLADRYGRSLGPGAPPFQPREAPTPISRRRRIGGVPDAPANPSPAGVHRSADLYHGSYNDYLWQLALADGELAQVLPPTPTEAAGPAPEVAGPSPEAAGPALAPPVEVDPAPGDEA